MEPILLKPTIKNLLWGSEQWGISAHQNGDNEVLNKEFEGLHPCIERMRRACLDGAAGAVGRRARMRGR